MDIEMRLSSEANKADLQIRSEGEKFIIKLAGRLDASTTGEIWRQTQQRLDRENPKEILVDASGIEYADGSGIAFLVDLRCRQQDRKGKFKIRELRDELNQLLNLYAPPTFEKPPPEKLQSFHIPEELGRLTYTIWSDWKASVIFIGELATNLAFAVLHPRSIRWREVLLIGEKAGVNALPIVVLISFLVGLIMAFQSAIPMRQFGVEIYVANLIALSMLRELGPLMTALTLAGRTGSSFAAELGTMKVNEEIDALLTMGIHPVRFLVITRIAAAVIMTPILTVFADLVGVMAGSLVLLSMGYPLVTYVNQVLSAVSWIDFSQGLLKSIVFGLVYSSIGCLRGLQTETGPSAVGDSATRAVVGGIIMIVVVDGIFAVIFYILGI